MMSAGSFPEDFEREIRRRIEQVMRELSRDISGLVDSALRMARPVVRRVLEEAEYLTPEHEVYLDGDEVVVVAQIPGASKDSIDLRIRERDLALEANLSEELRERAPRSRLFRPKGYRCTISLPREVDPAAAKATYRDGVLVLRVPVQKPKGVRIEIE